MSAYRRSRDDLHALSWAAALAAAAFVVLRLIRGEALWTAGEGIYGLTARMLLHGGDLYGGLIAAQPPNFFFAGAVILAVHDGDAVLRAGIGVFEIASAVLGASIVWRLTCSRAAAAVAGPIALLTPWAVHENAAFIPEFIALPLLLGAALLAARRRGCSAAGVIAALSVFVKLPMLLPVVALGLVAADRRRYALAASAALLFQAVLYTAIFGTGMWGDTVLAELQLGQRPLHTAAGMFAQASWNEIVLVALAATAVLQRAGAREPALLRTTATLALALLITGLSIEKQGTGLYAMVPIEAACVPLALAGTTWLIVRRRRAAGILAALGLTLMFTQSAALLIAPRHPYVFIRPGATNGYYVNLTDAQARTAVAAARRCPTALAYSGLSYIAFLAGRRMPGDQPDTYIVANARRFSSTRRRIEADRRRCPAHPPGV